MQAFVPKSRKPRFDLTLKIIDLNNIPIAVGTSHVKWHLPSSTAAEHRGRTEKVFIRDHKAIYDYTKQLPVRLTVDRSGVLEECPVHFEVVQDYAEGQKGGRVVLGKVKLNLSEYVERDGETRRNADREELGDEDGEGITRRYLMQDSKINSTLRVGILMKQVEGEKDFVVPQLKTATVFGGIAGIVATEAGDPKSGADSSPGNGDMAPLTKKTRELTEAQDMYRRTLAATWACRVGELPPDKLIEDLFAGGDGGSMRPPPESGKHGWGSSAKHAAAGGRADGDDTSSISDAESRRTVRPAFLSPDTVADSYRNGHNHSSIGSSSNSPGKHNKTGGHHHRRHGTRSGNGSGDSTSNSVGGGGSIDTTISGRGSIEGQMPDSLRDQQSHHQRRDQKEYKEVTEFDIREDLRSWTITEQGLSIAVGRSGSRHGGAHINRALLALESM